MKIFTALYLYNPPGEPPVRSMRCYVGHNISGRIYKIEIKLINKFIFAIPVFCLLASCNNDTSTTAPVITPEAEKDVITDTGNRCFLAIHKKDTIALQINLGINEVTGSLVYNLFEKDKNTGTIRGLLKGDTLIAQYTFMSEGVNSVREVAFLKKGNGLVEGYGEMEDKNGKLVFKNTGAITFENKITLENVDCAGK